MKTIAAVMVPLVFVTLACARPPATSPVVQPPATSPVGNQGQITIRTAPDPETCPAAAVPVPMRFKIANDGREYQVWWAPGFTAGDAADPVVRDPSGVIVASDGELLEAPLLHGHTVCATGDSIYVLLE
jgi:hypothetical protein